MAITVVPGSVTKAAQGTSSATITLPRPEGVAAGDTLLALVRFQIAASADLTSPGWSRVSHPFTSGDASRTYGIFTHVVAESEPESYVFSGPAGGRVVVVAVALRSSTGAAIHAAEYSTPYGGVTYSGGRSTAAFSTTHPDGLVAFAGVAEFTANNSHVPVDMPGTILNEWMPSSTNLSASRTLGLLSLLPAGGADVPAMHYTATGPSLTAVGAQAVVLYEDSPAPPQDLEVEVYTSGGMVSMKATGWDGEVERRLTGIEGLSTHHYGLSQMAADLASGEHVFWSHRGGSANWSEMTMRAYTNSIWHGCKVLEVSMWRSANGVWIASHDSNLDRVTGTTLGEIASTNSATLLGVPVIAPQGGGVTCRFEDIAQAYGDFVLVVDNKQGVAFQDWLDHLKVLRPDDWADKFLVKIDGSAGLTRYQQAKAAGFKVAAYFYGDTPDQTIIDRMPYVDYPGLNSTADQARWDMLLAFGKPAWSHVLQTVNGYNDSVAKGATIFQCANVKTLVPRVNYVP